MSVLASLMFGKRREDETPQERMLNDAVERGVVGHAGIQIVEKLTDPLMQHMPLIGRMFQDRGKNVDEALKRIELIKQSQALGMTTKQAMDDDILDKYGAEEKHNYLGRAKLGHDAFVTAQSIMPKHDPSGFLSSFIKPDTLREEMSIIAIAKKRPKFIR